MIKVLLIAPFSFPVNGAEHIVNLNLIKVLSNNGYSIDLISKRNKWENYPSNSLESYNISLNSLNILEVDNKISLKVIYEHIISFFKFGVITKGIHWSSKATEVANNLMKYNKYEYVLTRSGIASFVGYYLKKKYGLCWVSTWNDPYPIDKYPFPYGRGVEAKLPLLMRRSIRIFRDYVDYHIFPSIRLRDYMNLYLKVDLEKLIVIPHSLPHIESSKVRHLRNDNVLKLIHSGNIQNPRSPKLFLTSLKRFLADTPQACVFITFLGVADSNFNSMVKNLGLDNNVKLQSPVDYVKSIDSLTDYDCALIIEAPCEEGIFLPTKVADYQYSRIPVFSVSPVNGVLNDLYSEGYVSYFADCSDEEQIYYEIKKLYDDFVSNLFISNSKVNSNYLPEKIIEQFNKILSP